MYKLGPLFFFSNIDAKFTYPFMKTITVYCI